MNNPQSEVLNPLAGSAPAVHSAGSLISVEQQRAIAEVQARMLIARATPRDPEKAVALLLADCKRLSLAEDAIYAYARGGTDISGPSIKLAEAIARRWGNMASGIKEVSRQGGYSECIAYAWDLETGYYDERQFQVRHWRDKKDGKGYPVTDERDIYELTANMGQRRKRAVILSVIPGDVVEAAVAQCERTIVEKASTSPEAIATLLERFAEFGVTQAAIEKRIQRSMSAIKPANVISLKRIYTSLRDEMSTPADWFEMPAAAAKPAAPPPPAAKPEYPATDFEKELPKWRQLIDGGKKTAEQIIAMASTKHTLTDAQRAAIASKADPAPTGRPS